MGQPARAPTFPSHLGKILRMTADGALPAAPLAPNPILSSSFIYATGVRDPVRLTTDPATGDGWFIDRGPSDNDELNRVAGMVNYGWGPSLTMGYQDTVGLEDPFHVWTPAVAPSDLTTYASTRLGPYAGTLITVASGTGQIASVRPNFSDRHAPTVTVLFTPDATGPQAFGALAVLPDGFAYVVDETGTMDRFVTTGGTPREPSAIESVVPLWLRKLPGSDIEVAVERMAGAAEYGAYRGDLLSLTTSGYTHDATSALSMPADANVADAFTRFALTEADLGGPGAATYILVSARRDCIESGLGRGSYSDPPVPASACGIGVLGDGTHDIANVDVTVILSAADNLDLPRDLEFHPNVSNQLWVVNQRSSTVVICENAALPTQTSSIRSGPNGQHFMAQPSALAFGPGTGFFATSHEEDDYTQGPPPSGTPQDFMGPTLWIDDAATFDAGHMSHMDMLHNSPNAVGIAWEEANVYWVNDGYHGSLTRYDFGLPHEPGGSDHTDAIITRYVEGQMSYVSGIVSHVVYDPATGLVYAADTGNSRIAVLDPAMGTDGGATSPNYDGCVQRKVDGATTTTLVSSADYGLVSPSGMEMSDNMLFVSDNATSRISAFTMDGTLVDYLDTGFPPGTLMGMAFNPVDGSLYVVDTLTYRVLRLAAR